MSLNIIEGIQRGLEYQLLRDGQQVTKAYIKGKDILFVFQLDQARIYATKMLLTFFISYNLRRVLLRINMEYARYFLTLAKSAHNKVFKVPLNNFRRVSASTSFAYQANTF